MKKLFFRSFTLAFFAIITLLPKLTLQANDLQIFSPVFNSTFYAQANPDVVSDLGSDEMILFQHFISTGMAQGRQGSEEFNVFIYKEKYADLKSAFGEDLLSYYLHYINSGKAEGRVATSASYSGDLPSPKPTAIAPANAVYNPSNSLAESPLAPKAVESLTSYNNYWTWTASNGYPLKLKFDPNKTIYMKGYRGNISMPAIKDSRYLLPNNIIFDQPMNFRPEPGNSFLLAYVDFVEGYQHGYSAKIENFTISPYALPLIEMPKTKLSKAVSTPTWETFSKDFTSLWIQQVYDNSVPSFFPPKLQLMQPSPDKPIGTVIGINALNDSSRTNRIDFKLEYWDDADCWRLKLQFNEIDLPTELMWYGIRNCLRLITPDAELIYQQVYEHIYGGNHIFPDQNTWVPVGNSQMKVSSYLNHNRNESSVMYYYFK